jgi:hypothetical protein
MPKGDYEAAKTHCPQGHPYSIENTRVSAGSRYCRKCDSDKQKAKRRAGGRVVIPFRERTHCPRGHEYMEANTRTSVQGTRVCRACDRATQLARAIAAPERPMWEKARQRAQKAGVPFTIQLGDILIPPFCPVLGIPIQRNTGARGSSDSSPTLDRIEPQRGYVVGNVAVISWRANRIKNDATLIELQRIIEWLETALRFCGSVTEVSVSVSNRSVRDASYESLMCYSALRRAKKAGVPFAICVDDIVIPPCCPVLGIPLQRSTSGRMRDASPSMDRIVPEKGYVLGNIAVISYRANRIKNDATLEELKRIAAWMETTSGHRGN